MLGHVTCAVEFVAGIEKLLIVAFADELVQFGFGEGLFVQLARSKVDFEFEQETSCFAAGGSSWLLIKREFGGGHFSLSLR